MENTENVQATPQAEPRSDTTVGSNPLLADEYLRKCLTLTPDEEAALKELETAQFTGGRRPEGVTFDPTKTNPNDSIC